MTLFINDNRPVACGTACQTLPTFTPPSCEKYTVDNISMLYYSQVPFTADPTATPNTAFVTEFLARLSNSTTDANAVRFKAVNAELPDAQPDTVKNQWSIPIKKQINRKIEFVDDEDSDANYNWHRNMECSAIMRVWYVIGDRMYGGKNGILASFISVFSNTNSSEKTSNSWKTEINWVEKGQAPRYAVPA